MSTSAHFCARCGLRTVAPGTCKQCDGDVSAYREPKAGKAEKPSDKPEKGDAGAGPNKEPKGDKPEKAGKAEKPSDKPGE